MNRAEKSWRMETPKKQVCVQSQVCVSAIPASRRRVVERHAEEKL